MNKLIFSDPICFYINNDCNLTCKNCATLSNHNYIGSYSYKNYATYYEKWAELVDFLEIDLAGGEPFLHPELLTWATEIKRLWPNSEIHVYTNGTLLGYKENIKIAQQILDIDVGIHISCHNKKQLPMLEKYIKNLSSNKVRLEMYDKFFPSYVKGIENNIVDFRYGDRETSHSNCLYSTESFTMNQGLIFKCEMVKTYYNSKDQFSYKNEDKKILDKYKPCSPFDSIENIKSFIDNIYDSIEQCSLCGFNNMSMIREEWVPVTFEKRLKNN
jgi:organic radical activating enzyme